MAISERTLSEFLQHSGEILPHLDKGEVLLHRRGGEDLVLATKKQRDALREILRAFVRAADAGPSGVADALPWFGFLAEADQRACLGELRDVTLAWLESDRSNELVATLYAWRATALANWDARYQALNGADQADAPLPLPRPG